MNIERYDIYNCVHCSVSVKTVANIVCWIHYATGLDLLGVMLESS